MKQKPKEEYALIDRKGYVVQSNALIRSRQKLNWVEAKLVRLAIMQILRNDKQFLAYRIPIKVFCELLNIELDQYCGKKAKKICEGISRKPLQIQSGNDWRIIPWVSLCEYQSKNGNVTEGTIIIKLNDELKPYLLGLEKYYTQYAIDHVLAMQSKSIYGLRIFEFILSKIYTDIPKEGCEVEMSVEEVRICCDCENKYSEVGMLKKRVVEKATQEIKNCTIYDLEYSDITVGKRIVGFKFYIIQKYHHKEHTVSIEEKLNRNLPDKIYAEKDEWGQQRMDLDTLV